MRRAALFWLEPAFKGYGLRALAQRVHTLGKFVAPVTGWATRTNADHRCRANIVSVVQQKLRKARANIGLAHVDVQPGIFIDAVAVGVQKNWLLAGADYFEHEPVSVRTARGELRDNVENASVAVG
jgi:hypothetical protein